MLDEIVSHKRQETLAQKVQLPLPELLKKISGEPPPSFSSAIKQSEINVIAEIKYKSPSRGLFTCQIEPPELARLYSDNGAVALSVLTESRYFGGDIQFLKEIRKQLKKTPLLRKDFILDRYQVVESRAKGASAYLLIVACLEQQEIRDLVSYGADFQLEALVEVHDPHELDQALESEAMIIGVNNRNLHTFELDINTSFDIARRMESEKGYTLVSESGITEHSQIQELQDAGFDAFLVGSTLMDAADPAKKLRELVGIF